MKSIVERFDCVNKFKAEKSTLLRIVKTPNGTVEVDPTGKINGRGAYLKADKATLEKAKKTKALEKALEVKISDEVYEKIGRYLND